MVSHDNIFFESTTVLDLLKDKIGTCTDAVCLCIYMPAIDRSLAAVCFVYTCRHLIDLSLIAGTGVDINGDPDQQE